MAKIYIIDQDTQRKERTARFLAGLGYDIKTEESLAEFLGHADDAEEPLLALVGLTRLSEEQTALLRRAKTTLRRCSLILLLQAEDSDAGVTLLRENLVDQVASPDCRGSAYSAVRNELAKMTLSAELTACAQRLRRLGKEQHQNRRKALELEESYTATLENLMTALDLRDVETYGHSLTVAKYCQTLARLLGIKDASVLDNIRKGALLHDIGKIAIPDAILKKPSRLSAEEWEKLKLHPVLGYGLIKEIKMVKEVGNVILCHHERYDGSGYPKGLKTTEIPLEARIFALADALDAITSHRPYRKERDFKAARKEIQENRGGQFDPRVVDAFCAVPSEEWEKIRYETTKIMPGLESFSEMFRRS